MRMPLFRLAAALAAALPAGAALAHPSVLKAAPAPDAVVASPKEVRLVFSEAVMLPLSGIKLVDAAGKAVPTGKAKAGQDGKELVVPLAGPLPAGSYHVQWHVVSSDTHRVEGHYGFGVR